MRDYIRHMRGRSKLDLGSLRRQKTAAVRAAQIPCLVYGFTTCLSFDQYRNWQLPIDTMAKHVTLLDPPPQDHSKAPIENVLDLTPVVDLGPVRMPPYRSRTRSGWY